MTCSVLSRSSIRRVAWTLAACIVAGAFNLSSEVLAHGAEDHGHEEPKTAKKVSAGPRVTAQSDAFEIVGVPSAADGGKLLLYLDRAATNEPIRGAAIEVATGEATETAKEIEGRYEIAAPFVLHSGTTPLTFSVTVGGSSDLLIGTLDIPKPTTVVESHNTLWDHVRLDLPLLANPSPVLLGAVGVLGLICFVFWTSGPRGARPIARAGVIIVAMFGVALAAASVAGRLTAASSAQPVVIVLDQPETSRRGEDGAVFMPKVAQRLLDIGTQTAKASETANRTQKLIGEVIADPNRSGLVQTLLSGRIDPPSGGFPMLGARVKAGDTLAILTPRVEVVDQSDIRQTTGDLDRQIMLAESKLRRLERIKDVVAAAQITDAAIELDGLRARRAAIKPVLAEQEPLKAPVDGIIAQANVVSGQVVEAQTILFQIVNPETLMVEALSFDPTIAGSIERSNKSATASTSDGRNVQLAFAGRGPALRQQAVPLRFRIVGGQQINVGEPVTVIASIDDNISAIPLPRAAVVRSTNGQPAVWVATGVETYAPRVVTTVPIDADSIGVVSGIEAGARVVVRGAELISQVR